MHKGGFYQFSVRWFHYSAVINPPDEKLVNATSVHCNENR